MHAHEEGLRTAQAEGVDEEELLALGAMHAGREVVVDLRSSHSVGQLSNGAPLEGPFW
jgi:hypothetical protein